MEAKGVGVEGGEKEEVAKAVRLIMVEEEGESYRKRANDLRHEARNAAESQ